MNRSKDIAFMELNSICRNTHDDNHDNEIVDYIYENLKEFYPKPMSGYATVNDFLVYNSWNVPMKRSLLNRQLRIFALFNSNLPLKNNNNLQNVEKNSARRKRYNYKNRNNNHQNNQSQKNSNNNSDHVSLMCMYITGDDVSDLCSVAHSCLLHHDAVLFTIRSINLSKVTEVLATQQEGFGFEIRSLKSNVMVSVKLFYNHSQE